MQTGDGSNFNAAHGRKPVSEDALVDWIDGALSPEAVRQIAAESGRADLHDRIGQMQRHRAALRSLGDAAGGVRAPADMRTRVLAALERESLVGEESSGQELRALERAAPAQTTPIAQLRISREDGSRATWTSRAPALALAAGLLLLVTGGAYWTMLLARSASPRLTERSGVVARGEAAAGGDVAGEFASANGTTGATADGLVGEREGEVATLAMSAAETQGARAANSFAGIAAAAPASRQVAVEEAVELAREGRLAIRVTAKDLRGLAKLESDGGGPKGNQNWQLSREVPPAVLAAALPATSEASRAFVRAAYGAVAADAPATAMFSTASLVAPLIGPGAAVTSIAPVPVVTGPALSASYLLDVPQTERAFDGIRAILRDRLKADVVFAELPESVPTTARADAQTALWWTKPSSQWSPRVTVPVLIER
jgi:hypothetical protein